MTHDGATEVSRAVGTDQSSTGVVRVTKTELVWPGKYNGDGTVKDVPSINLPFQVVETINESRATRETRKAGVQSTLFEVYEGKEGDTFDEGWKNKLIWGDNLLVKGSLLEKFAGKIDLVYIDPPFATGADFSFTAEVGEEGYGLEKDQSVIEEKAYRDTWGRGLESYLDMMRPRLVLLRDLLSPTGSLYVHIGPPIAAYIKVLLDETFGSAQAIAEIVWKRTSSHNDPKRHGSVHDYIYYYAKGEERTWNQQYQAHDPSYIEKVYVYEDKHGRYRLGDLTAPGVSGGVTGKPWRGVNPSDFGRHWRRPPGELEKLLAEGRIQLKKDGKPSINGWKQYLADSAGMPLLSVWTDIPNVTGISNEKLGFPTQKPERLLDRIVQASSNPGDLVADFFCGSGTTLAVAEKLGRRWIGCDLGRWAIHISRKRLLSIPNCKPFEVLNLGKYERQYWQGVTFGGKDGKPRAEQALYEYLAFILKLHAAQPVAGMAHLHGKKGKAMVHIGAVDAPVTIDEINLALDECVKLKQSELHVLGWEWEMGLAGPNNDYRKGGLMHEVARQKGVKLVLLQIPREVMEEQAVSNGDVQFFELAYLNVEMKKAKKLTVMVALKDFVIPNTELISEDVREKVKKWSDYIDYWGVDWNFQNDTFMQGWVTFRTRKDRNLALVSDPHTYEKPGRYRILVKVVDIFGNDGSQAYDVEVA